MSFNFPNTPALNDKFTPLPGLNYIWDGLTWVLYPYQTAMPFNHVVNPSFVLSQEWGTTAISVATTYFADQWLISNTPAIATSQQHLATSPTTGSLTDCRVTITTAKTSFTGGDYFIPAMQFLEGHRMAGFMYGSSQAKPMVVRFTLQSPFMPGIGSFWIRNAVPDRSLVTRFNYAAGYNTIVLVIPGCTDGTWVADNRLWGSFGFTLGIGTTFANSTVNSWLNGNFLGATGLSSSTVAATVATYYNITDVGIYLDPFSTGLAPKWEPLSDEKATAECQRYWYPSRNAQGCTSGVYCAVARNRHPVPMRIAPAISISSPPPVAWEYNAGSANIIQIDNYCSTLVLCANLKTNGSFNTARACQMMPDNAGYLAVSARM